MNSLSVGVAEATKARAPALPSPLVLRDAATAITVVAALAYWLLPLTHDTGGRHSWTPAVAGVLTLIATTCVRPWRTLSGRHIALTMAPFVAAIVVGFVSPTGFSDLSLVASYGCAGGFYLVIRAWAATVAQRLAVLVIVMIGGLEQMSQAWLPWWGGQDAAMKMVGTFYWHNQFAGFVGAIALVAACAAVRGEGHVRLLGWIVAPVCACGVVLSASRSSLAILLLGWALLVANCLVARAGRVRALVLPVAVWLLSSLMTSAVLMGTAGNSTTALAARNGAESVTGNGGARLAMWRAAFHIWAQHPFFGGGFGSFRGDAPTFMPDGMQLSIFAHSGPIQAFSDGGLVLGTTMALAAAICLLRAGRACLSASWLDLASGLALLSLSMHTAVDNDWQYPALLLLNAVIAAVLPRSEPRVTTSVTGTAGSRLLATGVVVLVIASTMLAARARTLESVQVEGRGVWSRMVAQLGTSPMSRGLPASGQCVRALDAHDEARVREGLRCTRRAGSDDAILQLHRAGALVRLGRPVQGQEVAMAVERREGVKRPAVLLNAALVHESAGHHDLAVEAARTAYAELVRRGSKPSDLAFARSVLQHIGVAVDDIADTVGSGGHS